MKLHTIVIVATGKITVLVSQTTEELNQQFEEYVKDNWKEEAYLSINPPNTQSPLGEIDFKDDPQICQYTEIELSNTTFVVDNLLISQNPPLQALKSLYDQASLYGARTFSDYDLDCCLHDNYDEEYEKECQEVRDEIEQWLTKLGMKFES